MLNIANYNKVSTDGDRNGITYGHAGLLYMPTFVIVGVSSEARCEKWATSMVVVRFFIIVCKFVSPQLDDSYIIIRQY